MPDQAQTNPVLPLQGLTVADFTTAAAGPVCTMLLGDFGAEVIKVEPPTGESGRSWGSSRFGPHEEFSATFLAYNRNKLAVTLDLKSEEGQSRVKQLLAEADVVVENFRPGVADRLRIGYAAAVERNPSVVYCSISAFGQVGPLSRRPGFDMLMQAYTGHLSVTGEMGHPSVRIGHSAVDLLTGAHAAFGILAALRHREATGEGQYLDTSLYDTGLHLVSHYLAEFTGTGRLPDKAGARFAFLAPYGIFQAVDREFYMGVSGEAMWQRFCRIIDRPELEKDPRFASNRLRVNNQGELYALIEPILAHRKAEHWTEACDREGIPTSLVETIAEVADQEQARECGLLVDVGVGGAKVVGVPVRLHRTPGAVRRLPPPLGHDNERVLSPRPGIV